MSDARPQPIVTGVGLATGYGIGAVPCIEGLLAGRSPHHTWQAPTPPTEQEVRVPGPDLDALVATLPPQPLRGLNAETLCAQGVARMALADAGFPVDLLRSLRVGIAVSTQHAGLQDYAEQYRAGAVEESGFVSPTKAAQTGFNAPSGYLSIRLGNSGPNVTFVHGAVGGVDALIYAADALAVGRADAMIACGVDLLPPTMARLIDWERVPARARPFDGCRRGAGYGDVAAAVLMERPGARPGARGPHLAGMATAFSPAGDLKRAISSALGRSLEAGKVDPAEVVACIAGANGSRGGDAAEAISLASVVRPDLATCAVKGALGECFGATAIAQVALAVLCLERHEIPPTIGFEVPDPALRLEVTVTRQAIDPGPLLVQVWDPDGAAGAMVVTPEGGG